MSDKNKTVGENALQRVVRLLRKANDELVNVGTDERLRYVMQTSGEGELLVDSEEGTTILFGFGSPEALVKFLEARQLDRLKMVRDWASE